MRLLTGEDGVANIKDRVLDSTYVIGSDYPPVKPGSRYEKTYQALRQGPRDGYYLFFHGNHMSTKPGHPPMRPPEFREYLKGMVRKERIHVVRHNNVSRPL